MIKKCDTHQKYHTSIRLFYIGLYTYTQHVWWYKNVFNLVVTHDGNSLACLVYSKELKGEEEVKAPTYLDQQDVIFPPRPLKFMGIKANPLWSFACLECRTPLLCSALHMSSFQLKLTTLGFTLHKNNPLRFQTMYSRSTLKFIKEYAVQP